MAELVPFKKEKNMYFTGFNIQKQSRNILSDFHFSIEQILLKGAT